MRRDSLAQDLGFIQPLKYNHVRKYLRDDLRIFFFAVYSRITIIFSQKPKSEGLISGELKFFKRYGTWIIRTEFTSSIIRRHHHQCYDTFHSSHPAETFEPSS